MSKLAINGGAKLREKPYQQWPYVEEQDIQAVAEVLRSGRWGRLGQSRAGGKVREFEGKFAHYQDCEYGLAVNSGTAALEVGLIGAGVDVGDEVIVPPYTFMASATSILSVGAVPVFVDIDPWTYNIDPSLIEKAVTEKTKAIIAVHFGGLPADMDAICAIAKKHGLVVLEDASHSHGGIHTRGKLGSLGDVATFSFQASKNLTSGEGGAVTTNQYEIYAKAVQYHDLWRGGIRLPEDEYYLDDQVLFGVVAGNYRMSEVAGAILLCQLERLEETAARRAENAAYLASRLEQIEGLANIRTDPYVVRNAMHIFLFKYMNPEAFKGVERLKLARALQAEGIPVSGGYVTSVHKHPVFQNALQGSLRKGFPLTSSYYGRQMDYPAVECPESDRMCREETFWIGQSAFLGSRRDVDDIADAFVKVKENADELR